MVLIKELVHTGRLTILVLILLILGICEVKRILGGAIINVLSCLYL